MKNKDAIKALGRLLIDASRLEALRNIEECKSDYKTVLDTLEQEKTSDDIDGLKKSLHRVIPKCDISSAITEMHFENKIIDETIDRLHEQGLLTSSEKPTYSTPEEHIVSQARKALEEIDVVLEMPEKNADVMTRFWFEKFHGTIKTALEQLGGE